MEHKVINSHQGHVHYWVNHVENNKPAIVFTHGVTLNHMMFDPQVAHFQDNYTLITWDMPMHGQSNAYTDFSFEIASDLMKEILDQEGIQKVVLVGQSLGGMFSQAFADRHADYVVGIVGIDTAPFGTQYYPVKEVVKLIPNVMMAEWCPEIWLKSCISAWASFTPMGWIKMMQIIADLSSEQIDNISEKAYRAIMYENRDLHRKQPIRLLLGQFDMLGMMSYYSYIWNLVEGVPLSIIPMAGHNSNIDNPWMVNREIEYFIEKTLKIAA